MTMASPSSQPALAPPPGETTNFAEPDPLWKWNVLTQCACVGVSGICFLLRMYVRIWVKRCWLVEDCK